MMETKDRNQRSQPSNNGRNGTLKHHIHSIEDAEEKLQSLRQLNTMLLKETCELRQAKRAIEAELDLAGKMNRDFEMEFNKIRHEKSDLLEKIDGMERTLALNAKEKEDMGKKYHILLSECRETKDRLEENVKIIKEGFQKEMRAKAEEINTLEGELLQMEKLWGEEVEKGKYMEIEICALKEKIAEMEVRHGNLVEEKDMSDGHLKEMRKDMKKKDELIQKLEIDVREIEEIKLVRDDEIMKLREEVSLLKNALLAMEEAIGDQGTHGFSKHEARTSMSVAARVNSFRDALARTRIKTEHAQMRAAEEEERSNKLRSEVAEMENKIHEILNDFMLEKQQHEKLAKKNEVSETQISALKREVAFAEEKLVVARSEHEELIARKEAIDAELSNRNVVVEEMREEIEFQRFSMEGFRRKFGLLAVVTFSGAAVAALLGVACAYCL